MVSPQPVAKPNLRDVVAAERAAIEAGSATACGYTCPCHGAQPCVRAAHIDEHGTRTPHVAIVGDGLMQWAGPCGDELPAPPAWALTPAE